MGPFPHDAPKARISAQNPAGTDGFEFVEFAHPDPAALRALFARMGFAHVASHRTRQIELWQQGDVSYLLNAQPGSFAADFADLHGPCAPSMAWRVVDARRALEHALSRGAREYTGDGKCLDVPAIYGIGGSLLYFVENYGAGQDAYAAQYDYVAPKKPAGDGFLYLDHLTHNVFRGNMDRWFKFYADLFNFRQIRFFDIAGKYTGLHSRALTSPDGRIRIPINEDRGETGQIVSYLKKYNGEGIQHIALGCDDIYAATERIAARGLAFMPGPNAAYYAQSHARVRGHAEPLDQLMKHGILIDGEGVVEGGETRILLQIFSKTVIGPIFFEFIQRKGDDGFGEGNFKALFESIERDQIESGEIKPGA